MFLGKEKSLILTSSVFEKRGVPRFSRCGCLTVNCQCHTAVDISFKEVIGLKIHFYMLFEHKCLLAVCVHNHPIMIKIHPVVFFLIFINNFPFFKSSHSQIIVCVTSHRPRPLPQLLIDMGVLP